MFVVADSLEQPGIRVLKSVLCGLSVRLVNSVLMSRELGNSEKHFVDNCDLNRNIIVYVTLCTWHVVYTEHAATNSSYVTDRLTDRPRQDR